MSSPNSADRVLARIFESPKQSSLEASSLAAILTLLSEGQLVADSSSRPVAAVVAAVKEFVPDGAAKVSALSQLASVSRLEVQQ